VALIRATLELLERHSLYVGLLNEAMGVVLDVSIFERLGNDAQRLARALNDKGKLWLLCYPELSLNMPILHALWRSDLGGYITRGSGSGLTFGAAAESALAELVQLDQQFKNGVPKENGQGYVDWARPEAIDHISRYLDNQPRSSFTPDAGTLRDDSALAELTKRFDEMGSEILVVDLPCPVPTWSVVRVLAPGVVTGPTPSQSRAGSLITERVFPFAIPS
jgi:ribosomal protein S12 methylthiotransferase accessory factor YcaO